MPGTKLPKNKLPVTKLPVTKLDGRFSDDGVEPTPWDQGRHVLAEAQLYWLTTVRPDGRPHVTPLLSVWLNEAIYFCTGPTERKAKNLVKNKSCIITTGNNSLNEGLDVVIEGKAVAVMDATKLQQVADAYESKYGSGWHFDVTAGGFVSKGGKALAFEVAPNKGFGFGKGKFSQTSWRF
jgi:nitroimidazol reductase NimA-like FMN-containing flavoprotein (pyridoxamine 5'-phosphate oxidase superfamily)